ncbi:MAG: hypothetical protein WBL31_02015 [Ilumatobacteraceae bacterium]
MIEILEQPLTQTTKAIAWFVGLLVETRLGVIDDCSQDQLLAPAPWRFPSILQPSGDDDEAHVHAADQCEIVESYVAVWEEQGAEHPHRSRSRFLVVKLDEFTQQEIVHLVDRVRKRLAFDRR